MAGKVDSGWLAEVWIADIGLPHFSDAMATHLVDGRVLESLTKEDLKKYFKMTKKLEQMSFFTGVEMLRMHDYNREVSLLVPEEAVLDSNVCVPLQAILEHRASQQSRGSPQKPLYWTNRDVGDWLRDIQLGVSGGPLWGRLSMYVPLASAGIHHKPTGQWSAWSTPLSGERGEE